MSKIVYPSSSPYSATPQTNFSIGVYKARSIPAASDDQIITLAKKYEYRPDTLSYDLYGTPAYWWIFAVRNRSTIIDPIWDMVAGTSITVPSLTSLQKALGS